MLENTFKKKAEKLIVHFNQGSYLTVIREAKALLNKVPNNLFLLNLIGSCYQKTNNLNEAEIIFKKILAIDNKNISALNNLANVYKSLKNYSLAEENYKKSLNLNPNFVSALVNYGNLKYEVNNYNESIKLYQKALSINSDLPLANYNLGLVYQALGHFDKAKFHLEKISTTIPKMTTADKILSRFTEYKDGDPHIKIMETKLNTLDLNDVEKINLYFGLGKAFEDLKNYNKSFYYLKSGNNLKKKISNYQTEIDKKNFETLKEFFDKINFNKINTNEYNKKFIFIVGMPRSGTSLVEQILSSHSNVYGAGELSYLENLAQNEFFENNLLNINKLQKLNDISSLKTFGDNYFSLISKYNYSENFVTDKAPLNFRWVGLIKLILPDSKIIHCSRSPKDNCLSLYKNIFDENLDWSYNEDDLSNFYQYYLDLMKFWDKKIPNFIYNINYENLISNSESEIKNLLDFCNLGWEKNCMNFYENKRAIKTVSSSQARKNFYTSSISSYKNYEQFLSKLYTSLDKI